MLALQAAEILVTWISEDNARANAREDLNLHVIGHLRRHWRDLRDFGQRHPDAHGAWVVVRAQLVEDRREGELSVYPLLLSLDFSEHEVPRNEPAPTVSWFDPDSGREVDGDYIDEFQNEPVTRQDVTFSFRVGVSEWRDFANPRPAAPPPPADVPAGGPPDIDATDPSPFSDPPADPGGQPVPAGDAGAPAPPVRAGKAATPADSPPHEVDPHGDRPAPAQAPVTPAVHEDATAGSVPPIAADVTADDAPSHATVAASDPFSPGEPTAPQDGVPSLAHAGADPAAANPEVGESGSEPADDTSAQHEGGDGQGEAVGAHGGGEQGGGGDEPRDRGGGHDDAAGSVGSRDGAVEMPPPTQVYPFTDVPATQEPAKHDVGGRTSVSPVWQGGGSDGSGGPGGAGGDPFSPATSPASQEVIRGYEGDATQQPADVVASDTTFPGSPAGSSQAGADQPSAPSGSGEAGMAGSYQPGSGPPSGSGEAGTAGSYQPGNSIEGGGFSEASGLTDASGGEGIPAPPVDLSDPHPPSGGPQDGDGPTRDDQDLKNLMKGGH
jgi:hypothetical protein